MTACTNYVGTRAATLKAAQDLDTLRGWTTAPAVAAAWAAVSVN